MSSVPNPPPVVTPILTSPLELMQARFRQDPVLDLIQKNLPAAFTQASQQERKDYCAALLASRRAKEALKQLFKPLKGLSEFTEPLLREALDARFGPGLDARTDRLFYVHWERATRAGTELTLLESALHNFERKESVAGYLRASAGILNTSNQTHPKGIKPQEFIDLCRHLNLGRKYQDHLSEVLEPDSAPGDAKDAARFNARAIFMANDQADMEVYARAAAMTKGISRQACSAAIALARQQPKPRFNGELLLLQRLTLFGIEIPRVLLISPRRVWTTTQVPTVMYIPQDPVSPFTEYTSLVELENDLRTRLMDKSYQSFFARLIGERQRAEFFTHLNKHLFPLMPLDGSMFTRGLWHHAADPTANLVVGTDRLLENPFSRMHRQHLFLLKDNARFLAVPTEEEDAKSRQERLQFWLSVGMNVLNVASFVIPPLGAVMMIDATLELVGEVYHGLQDLSHGDLEEGLDHLMGAAGQIAFMALLVAGHQVPEPPPITGNNFIGKVVPITLNNGKTRLWKPDLTPFELRSALPEGVRTDGAGVIDHDGKKYLSIDDKHYEIQHHKTLNRWVIKHPNNEHLFSPALEHNGVGAFRHEGEQAQQWAKDKLFKRLGHSVSGLSETAAEEILAITDIDESVLRQVHSDSVPPPGQLSDTIKRFKLDSRLETSNSEPGTTRADQFERLYTASEISTDPLVKVIQRDFPTTPEAVAEDMLVTLTTAEKQQMLDTGRIPLRVAEAAAWQQSETRLNRALEGFFLKSVRNADTETLSLRLLTQLPGWSDQVRLEVREGSPSGLLLDSVGEPQASERKILVKSKGQYQAFDADAKELNGIPRDGNNLCASILHALPDGPRKELGFPQAGQGAELNQALARLATSDRQQASRALGQQKIRLKFNSPKRIKRARLGYPLSGRGMLPGYILEDHLLDKIGLLELDGITPQQVIAGMREAGMTNADVNARLDVLLEERRALRASLSQWADSSSAIEGMSALRMASRTRIGESIEAYWQASVLGTGEATATLRLGNVGLEDFPEQLPDFFLNRVQWLQMSDVLLRMDRSHFSLYAPDRTDVLEAFFSRLPQLTSLEITSSVSAAFLTPNFVALPRIVSTHLPNLRALSLTNQGMDFQAADLERFTGLQHLERLDLSGNNFTAFNAPAEAIHLNLRYLGLDRVGLERWPAWLNNLLPDHIDELSLNDNRIAVLPDHIIGRELNTPTHTRISLRGNQLSRSTILEALLGEARAGGSFSFNMDVPPALELRLVELLQEQAELETALRDWEAASPPSADYLGDTPQTRRQISEGLLRHWSRAVAGRSPLAVLVESSLLSSFPQQLPEAFYRNVSELILRNVVADEAQLDHFLARFQRITSLDIVNHSPALTAPPRILAELPRLRELGLTEHDMLIDQDAMEFLGGLEGLQHLNLSGNRLDSITITPPLAGLYWESLTLDNMGLAQWPEWLTELVPTHITSLSLCENDLIEIPDEILRNRRNDVAHTEISLNENPLSRETMVAAHVGEHGNHRSFSFYMDLPDDIRNLPTERAWSSDPGSSDSGSDSDSDSDSDFAVHRHGRLNPSPSGRPTVDPWLMGTSDEMAAHRAVWVELDTSDDASEFMALIGRLQESADFHRARSELTLRVWNVLEAAAQDVELRMLLNVMAEEPIANRTCADGIRLQFNQMEVQVYTRNSLRGIPETERGPVLFRLMRQLYRLDEVDRIALANNRGRDAAEVRMAYRLSLAERLGLPQPPTNMLYRAAASVTPEELLLVQTEVMTNQHGAGFLTSAVDRDFWVSWLRDAYATEFAELEATFQQERVRLEDEFPEMNDEYLNRADVLQEQQKDRERNLIRELTHREGLKYDD